VTEDIAQTTSSLVPSKRKADDEIRRPDKTSRFWLNEDVIDCGPRASLEENYDRIYAAIQKESFLEDALCSASELDADYAVSSRAEKFFDENSDLFQDQDHEHDSPRTNHHIQVELEDVDQIHTAILQESLDEDDIRVEAEFGVDYARALRAERFFDENEDLLDERDEEQEQNEHAAYADHTDHEPDEYSWFERQMMEQDVVSFWEDFNIVPQQTKDDLYFKARIQSDPADVLNPRFQNELCRRCRAVRWSALTRLRLSKPRQVWSLEDSPLKLLDSSCKLCQFLGKIGMSKENLSDSLDGTLEFKINITRSHGESTRVLIIYINRETEGSLITVHSTPFKEEWNPRITNLESINYHALRRMVSSCRHSHVITCQTKRRVKLSGFKVINCSSREVVLAPAKCKYVALSYVWGGSTVVEDQDSDACYPLTIEDSLRVTREMGFSYLWVDRYCLDQENKVEKHEFIQNMDQIYTNAQLTIIAAAGHDPTYGLPGVGSRPRSLQHHVRIGNTKLVQLMRPGSDFPKSSWWERAWTYQEAVLSKRKLVFTDHQVFYVCNKMHSAESLHMQATVVNDTISLFTSTSLTEMILPTAPRSYESYLSAISRRALSHQSDALNACLGILKATNTTHIWGVPIEYDFDSRVLTMDLCWRQDVPSSRRPGFPSWSWAGWKGGVTFQNSVSTRLLCTIQLGDDDWYWQTVPEYVSSGRAEKAAGKSNAPRLVHMTGPVLDAALLHSQWPDLDDVETGATGPQDDRPRPIFLLESGGLSSLATLYLDQKMDNAEQLCDVIAMGVKPGADDTCFSTLLLKPSGDFYSRVGMMTISCVHLTCREPYGQHLFWDIRAEMRTVIVE
jgi:hypothetical protein